MRRSRPCAKQRGITALGRRVARSSAQRQSVLIRIGSVHRAGNLSWAAAGPVGSPPSECCSQWLPRDRPTLASLLVVIGGAAIPPCGRRLGDYVGFGFPHLETHRGWPTRAPAPRLAM